MTGINGLGTRALAGQQGPVAAARAAKYDDLGMTVTPANVLDIYSVVEEEVTRLRASIENFRRNHGGGTMPELGGDLVSPYAARGFTEATQQLLAKCGAEVDILSRVAQQLADAARAYGKSEAEISAAFDYSKFVYEPTPLSRLEPRTPPHKLWTQRRLSRCRLEGLATARHEARGDHPIRLCLGRGGWGRGDRLRCRLRWPHPTARHAPTTRTDPPGATAAPSGDSDGRGEPVLTA